MLERFREDTSGSAENRTIAHGNMNAGKIKGAPDKRLEESGSAHIRPFHVLLYTGALVTQ